MAGIGGNSASVGITALSAVGVPVFCGRTADGSPSPIDCVESTPPSIPMTLEILGESNGRVLTDTATSFLPLFSETLGNAFQTMDAAVRVDFGHTIYNNFLTNADLGPLALSPTFPTLTLSPNGTVSSTGEHSSTLYELVTGTFGDLTPDQTAIVSLPLDASQPSRLQVPYLCHFSTRKSTGSLIVSVLVATLSMFTAGYGFVMFIASNIETFHRPEGEFTSTLYQAGY